MIPLTKINVRFTLRFTSFRTAFHLVLGIVILVIFSWQWSPIDTVLTNLNRTYCLPCPSSEISPRVTRDRVTLNHYYHVVGGLFVAVLRRYSALTLGPVVEMPQLSVVVLLVVPHPLTFRYAALLPVPLWTTRLLSQTCVQHLT